MVHNYYTPNVFVPSLYVLLGIDGVCVGHQGAALLATLFDVGGIAGTQKCSMPIQHVSKEVIF